MVERGGTSQERDRRKGIGGQEAGKTSKGYVIDGYVKMALDSVEIPKIKSSYGKCLGGKVKKE